MTLTLILQWILEYKYIILFPLTAVEGPITGIFAGLAVSMGYMSGPVAYTVVVIGDLFGDTFYYIVGRWGGRKWLTRLTRYFGVKTQIIAKFEGHFKKHPGKTLLAGKAAHGLGSAILTAAGISGMPYGNFILFNLLGTIPKSLILILVGYYFGHSYNTINSGLEYATDIVFIVVILVILYLFINRMYKKMIKL